MAKWNSVNVPVSFDSYFSGCIYYKDYHLGRDFQEEFPIGTSSHVVYSFQQTDHYVTINLDYQLLRMVPDSNGRNTMAPCPTCHSVLCTNTYHTCFCGWKAIKQNEEKQWVPGGIKAVGITWRI